MKTTPTPSPGANFGHSITAHANRSGLRPAITDADRRLDYRGFHERVCRCVAVLKTHRLGAGDRVGLLLGNRTAYLETVFAAARIGAIAVPINARFTAHEVTRVLDDCHPALLIHDDSLAALAADAASASCTPPRLLACPSAYESALAAAYTDLSVAPVVPDAPMLLMYTSGTTGVPKGAVLPHRKTLYNCMNAEQFLELSMHDRVLVVLPLFHSFGLQILSLPTLYCGGHVRLEPHFDPRATWNRVAEDRITVMGAVPTQLESLLENQPSMHDAHSLRFVFGAGAAVSVEQIKAYRKLGIVLKQGFGQTETSILCCLDARDAIRKAGSVGRPVPHAEVRVVDPAGLAKDPTTWRDVDSGEPGEIVVRGPITMLGYWERPAATAQTLRGEWLLTGDRATVDDEGFLTLVGRARDMYISGGENVYPAEIEAVLREHPSIVDAAIVGTPHVRWGETGRAYLVLREPYPTISELVSFLSTRLARFKHPLEWFRVDEFPRTQTGKTQKHRLDRASATPLR